MKRVLIVDDNEGILDVLSILLELEGYHVQTQSNGIEVLDTVISYKPDIILLDVMLGLFDGREICNLIKTNPLTSHISIIIVSASHGLDKTYCLADDFIAKPFDIGYLASKVAHFTL